MTEEPHDDITLEELDGEPLVALVRPAADFADALPADLDPDLAELVDAMAAYASAAQAPNTTKAYESDWRQFEHWADGHLLVAMPAAPATCALYLTALAKRGLKVSTIRRRAAAITRAHRQANHPSPVWDPRVLTVMEGIARTHGTPPAKKVALLRDPLLELVDRIDRTTSAGLRDRALLLLGFALGLRRSELVAIRVEDLSPHHDGLTVRLAGSKTDQTGRGHVFLLAFAEAPNPCPVRAVRAWVDHAGLTSGPIARRVTRTGAASSPLSAQSIALIVKRRAKAAGLPARDYAGHSLRSGFSTQAARDGYLPAQIADTTRHKDRRTLDGYIQAGKGAAHVARVL
jgi:site-specific recombinase XerD